MLNTNRILDIAIFTIKEEKLIGDTLLLPGIQQLKREGDFYHLSLIGEEPYAKLSLKYNEPLLRSIYNHNMFDA